MLWQTQGARHSLGRAFASWWSPNNTEAIGRGQPAPLGPEEKRPAAAMQHLPPLAYPIEKRLPRYDWGAAGWSYQSGITVSDVVGNGWIVTKHFDAMRRTGTFLMGRVFYGPQFPPDLGAIPWNTTSQNQGQQPLLLPLYNPAQLRAMYGNQTASAIAPVPPPSPYASGVMG